MDLKTFVAETISQILDGVREAQRRASELGGSVNPDITSGRVSRELFVNNGLLFAGEGVAQLVQFDVAVTATEGTGTRGGIGLVVGPITLGSAGQSQAENSASSRVRFIVPVVLPPAPTP